MRRGGVSGRIPGAAGNLEEPGTTIAYIMDVGGTKSARKEKHVENLEEAAPSP